MVITRWGLCIYIFSMKRTLCGGRNVLFVVMYFYINVNMWFLFWGRLWLHDKCLCFCELRWMYYEISFMYR